MAIGIFIAGVLFGVVLAVWLRRSPSPQWPQPSGHATDASTDKPDESAAGALPAPADEPAKDTAVAEETPADKLYRLRREIESDDDRIQSPEDLLRSPQFGEGVALLTGPAFAPKDLLDLLENDSYALGCMLYAALRERGDVDAHAALAATPSPGRFQLKFMLDYLQSQADASAL